MIFGKTDTSSASGSILAHSLRVQNGRIRKGTLLDARHIEELLSNGINNLTVARLEANDVHEDDAASLLAKALAGQGIELGKASTGRVNCYAKHTGLLSVPRDRVLACNHISESITASTLSENRWVDAGKMVATIKIIPYAVPKDTLDTAIEARGTDQSAKPLPNTLEHTLLTKLCVFTPNQRYADLVQTTLPNTPATLLEKTTNITRRRLNLRNVDLLSNTHCTHDVNELAQRLNAIAAQQSNSADYKDNESQDTHHWILISGASAISDRRDVIPQAVEQAGGSVSRCGIPVDPGNLLMLGKVENSTVIGIPGCARSPKHNGLDLFMDRLACNLPITQDWINSLAIGGLMDEIIDRPQPRVQADIQERVTAILLAAGSSKRFGKENKLLALKNGQTLVHHALSSIAASRLQRLIVVLGHEADAVEQHCRDFFNNRNNRNNSTSSTSSTSDNDNEQHKNIDIEFVVNTDFDSGMASSLRTGVSHLLNRNLRSDTQQANAAMVFLADMPSVKPTTINTLIDSLETDALKNTHNAAHQSLSAFVPMYKQSRGNPVILMPELFDLLLDVAGDVGAKHLLQANPDAVLEVAVDDAGILQDFDTPDQLHNDTTAQQGPSS